MSTKDIEDMFQPDLQSPDEYKYLSIVKITEQENLVTNNQPVYTNVFDAAGIDQSLDYVETTNLSNNFSSSAEPPSDALINSANYPFLGDHNYSHSYVNTQMTSLNFDLALLVQKSYSHKCDYCDKMFANMTSLRRHIRSHTNERPFHCEICDKWFSQQSNLWKHIRIHTGERPFECPECKRKFSQRANMQKHMMIHSGEKPFECPYCWRSFTQLANLNKHVQLHLGTQPYKCKYCDKGFSQLSNMRKHQYIHEGIKPYSCSFCRISFTQQSNLKKHLVLHADEKPYICGECGKTYVQKISMTKHREHCTGQLLDPIESLFNIGPNKYIKIIQTDGHQKNYYITEENDLIKLEDNVAAQDHVAIAEGDSSESNASSSA